MFDISPEKLLVLIVVGLIVLGPDRLPSLARDAARLLRTLRDLSRTTRQQLTDELGPELSALDLGALNPRTALDRLLADDPSDTEPLDPKMSAPLPSSLDLEPPIDPEAT